MSGRRSTLDWSDDVYDKVVEGLKANPMGAPSEIRHKLLETGSVTLTGAQNPNNFNSMITNIRTKLVKSGILQPLPTHRRTKSSPGLLCAPVPSSAPIVDPAPSIASPALISASPLITAMPNANAQALRERAAIHKGLSPGAPTASSVLQAKVQELAFNTALSQAKKLGLSEEEARKVAEKKSAPKAPAAALAELATPSTPSVVAPPLPVSLPIVTQDITRHMNSSTPSFIDPILEEIDFGVRHSPKKRAREPIVWPTHPIKHAEHLKFLKPADELFTSHLIGLSLSTNKVIYLLRIPHYASCVLRETNSVFSLHIVHNSAADILLDHISRLADQTSLRFASPYEDDSTRRFVCEIPLPPHANHGDVKLKKDTTLPAGAESHLYIIEIGRLD